jgi:hypothetical protein
MLRSFDDTVILLLLKRLGDLFHSPVRDRPKCRPFLAAIGFFVTFVVARAMVRALPQRRAFFITFTFAARIFTISGILLPLAVGFCWLIEVGEGSLRLFWSVV